MIIINKTIYKKLYMKKKKKNHENPILGTYNLHSLQGQP